MVYHSLRQCIDDLDQSGQLRRIEVEIDPYLEAAEIQRRVYAVGGPAIYFARLKGCRFPAVSNLFGTKQRIRFLFRRALPSLERIFKLAQNGGLPAMRDALASIGSLALLRHALPRSAWRRPLLANTCRLSDLPAITSWPMDGGPFVTLPIVYSESPKKPGWRNSNIGMYRVQIAGNQYRPDAEVGVHYQIHRGIGVHHKEALQAGHQLPVHIYVGGPPAMTVAAVMPLPEGLPEVAFAGLLGGRPTYWARKTSPLPFWVDADFCISGVIHPGVNKPEGPFGDHLGYYSLQHDYPVLEVHQVYHRPDAVWPFTVVGRPPQEDTSFGDFIHELTGPMIPKVLPGVLGVHAVDAAGVHPLLLAVGSERYQPYLSNTTQPQELLTQANAILGQGQLSLAKYLFILNAADAPGVDLHNAGEFLQEMLRRVDWRRDLHFITQTTIDTLDYSGASVNQGSKLVVAARGAPVRKLPTEISADVVLPPGFGPAYCAAPGVLAVQSPRWSRGESEEYSPSLLQFLRFYDAQAPIDRFPLIILCDDAEFTARSENNWLWVTFTRSNPAADVHGIEADFYQKHWGCRGSLVIDARLKDHHAPPLVEDSAVSRKVDELAARGGPLHGLF